MVLCLLYPGIEFATRFGILVYTNILLSRFVQLERNMNHWSGPVSAAFYVAPDELDELQTHIEKMPNYIKRNNTDIPIVFKAGVGVQKMQSYWNQQPALDSPNKKK